MTSMGDSAQIRLIVEQVVESAITKILPYPPSPPPAPKPELPAPLKWAGAIMAAVMTACAVAMAIWVVTTLSDLQQTVTRIDERQKLGGDSVAKRIDDVESRLTRIEVSGQERVHK